jgi:hypothetical protein
VEVTTVDDNAVLLSSDGSSVDNRIDELFDESRRGSVETKGEVNLETLDVGRAISIQCDDLAH